MAYQLTAADIRALRGCDRIAITYDSTDKTSIVRIISKTPRSTRRGVTIDRPDSEHIIPAPVNQSAPGIGSFALIYPSGPSPERTAIESLRTGDSISFAFDPDAHTNGYTATAGLHADRLLMHVTRGEDEARKSFTFVVASSITPENSARMCRGVPFSNFHTPRTAAATDLAFTNSSTSVSSAEEDRCRNCAGPIDDGESYDGRCGNCADRHEASR